MASLFELKVGDETQLRNIWKQVGFDKDLAEEIIGPDGHKIAASMVSRARTLLQHKYFHGAYQFKADGTALAALKKLLGEGLEVEPRLLRKLMGLAKHGAAAEEWTKQNRGIGNLVLPKTANRQIALRYTHMCRLESARWWHLLMELQVWVHWLRTEWNGTPKHVLNPRIVLVEPYPPGEGDKRAYLTLRKGFHTTSRWYLDEDVSDRDDERSGWGKGTFFLVRMPDTDDEPVDTEE